MILSGVVDLPLVVADGEDFIDAGIVKVQVGVKELRYLDGRVVAVLESR